MPRPSGKHALDESPSFLGEGRYPIAAYSEFLPPIRLGRSPYGTRDPSSSLGDGPDGWAITESEEALELIHGLASIARQVLGALVRLGRGEPAHGIARSKLEDNPYWPPELAGHAGALPHERYVVLLPLALSKTQDDKGRRRWTLFGGSEQGPGRAFWRSVARETDDGTSGTEALAFLRRLLSEAYGVPPRALNDLARAGLRILPDPGDGTLPGWTEPYLWTVGGSLTKVRFLLTFRPFARLPPEVKRAYLEGRVHLLPFPGSLLPWGVAGYRTLEAELPLASQIPLLHLVARHESPHAIRVPQSGWLHEPSPGRPAPRHRHGPIRNTFRRSHRNDRDGRDVEDVGVSAREDRMAHVLFSTDPDDVGLYGKPMARNVQLWTREFRLLLDGPNATPEQLLLAARQVAGGGLFGYRFQYPAMRIGAYEVYWQRPLVAFLSPATGAVAVLPDAPLGYLTAYPAVRPEPAAAIELRPRLLRREAHLAAVQLLASSRRGAAEKVLKLLDARQVLGDRRLPPDFARQLLSLPGHMTFATWGDEVAACAGDPEQGRVLADAVSRSVALKSSRPSAATRMTGLTFDRTASRRFEVAYWKTIATLSEGRYLNKNNADVVRDAATRSALTHDGRDLGPLGEYLLKRHRRSIVAAAMGGEAVAGSVPFTWRTDFAFPWMGGWLENREGKARERDLLVVIPGRDRRRAVIMADHYDTAYRADRYEVESGGTGARLAAAGADDNASATATLLLAAPIFLALSREGRLGCDVWLVHLTGEEFPADCLGARQLCQRLVERTLALDLPGGRHRDLSQTTVQGVYVLDMVAHNNDRDRDIFQIAPGRSREAYGLAYQAHLANRAWNASTVAWNRRGARRGRPRAGRSPDAARIPAVAPHLALSGEVRPPDDPRSTLYNTDGQIFSDAGVPVVLFMENYDINRSGYHDSQDTMANIDLDYGAAVAAIAIEAVARAATRPPGNFAE